MQFFIEYWIVLELNVQIFTKKHFFRDIRLKDQRNPMQYDRKWTKDSNLKHLNGIFLNWNASLLFTCDLIKQNVSSPNRAACSLCLICIDILAFLLVIFINQPTYGARQPLLNKKPRCSTQVHNDENRLTSSKRHLNYATKHMKTKVTNPI